MSELTHEQKSLALVLARMQGQVMGDPAYAEVYAVALEALLDALHCEDFFGTEGQEDPRGDFRNGNWSVSDAEGA